MKTLSKSRLLKGFQCPKSLYLSLFKAELEAETDEATQRRFDDGTMVGELARKEFPGGVLIEGEYSDYAGFLSRTKTAMGSKAPAIFEAAFQWDGFFFRADVLKRSTQGAWDLIEVKMSGSVKEVHLQDLAVQKIICEGNGVAVRKMFLMHINTQCVHPDLFNLFHREDVTNDVLAIVDKTRTEMQALSNMVAKKSEPKVAIGPHCDAPYACSFKGQCWKHVPSPGIFDIPGLRAWTFHDKGILTLKALGKEKLSPKVTAYLECHLQKKRIVNATEIRKELKSWEWPLTLIDFETISYPVPRLPGTSPYEQVPFQAACSIWESRRSKKFLELDFLDVDVNDPREALARHMAEKLPNKGSVVAYHMGFEAAVLKTLAERFPEFRKALLSLVDRLVDPLPLLRAAVYDPAFGSSFSLKSTAPALLGKAASYTGMRVADGDGAQQAYLDLREGKLSSVEKKKLREALVDYCRKDTETMRQLVAWLFDQV